MYHYKFKPLPRSTDGQVYVRFSVRAKEDVHISLVAENNDLPKMYEIVIGGWEDRGSVIRRKKQELPPAIRVNNTSGWLDAQQNKQFWVRATPGTDLDGSATVTVAVGQGSAEEPFMKFVDHSPLQVNYLGFSSWGSAVGNYTFCGLDLKP